MPKILFTLIIVALIIAVALGIYFWKASDKNNSIKTDGSLDNATASDWIEYKNPKYGVEFSYPKAWGSPQFMADSGQYQVSFVPKNAPPKYSASLIFGSNGGAPTSKDVQQALSKKDKSSFIKYDDKSVTTLRLNPDAQTASDLTILQTVALTRINISAVIVSATIKSAKSCTIKGLAKNPSDTCFTEDDYSTMNRFAKSIQNTQ